jgi:steroid delta-isomerase-like uncharacterized protein
MSKRELVTECFRTVDDRRFEQVPRFHSETCHYRMNDTEFTGTAPFVQMSQGWYGGFPDLRHEVLDYIEDGDRAGFTVRITGTHTSTMRTPQGDVPATGKRIDVRAVDVVQFGADGRAVSWHIYFDMLQMLQQLGIA